MQYCWVLNNVKSEKHDVVVIAGNGKYNFAEIKLLLRKIEEGYDYVQGSRYLEESNYQGLLFHRKIFKSIWPFFWSVITWLKQTEVSNGFQAFRLSILDDPNRDLNKDWLYVYALEYYIHFNLIKNKIYKFTEVLVSKIYKKKKDYLKINILRDWKDILLFLSNTFIIKIKK